MVKNGWRAISISSIPTPKSVTVISSLFPLILASKIIFPPFPPYYYYYYYLIILVCIYKKNENLKFKGEDKNETNFK